MVFKGLMIVEKHATSKQNIYICTSSFAMEMQINLSGDRAKGHPENIKLRTPL